MTSDSDGTGTRTRRRKHIQSRPGLLELAVTLYVASTVIEGAAFSVGQSRVSRLTAVVLVFVVIGHVVSQRLPRNANPALIGILGISGLVAASLLWTETPVETSARLVTFVGLAVTSVALAGALARLGDRGVRCIEQGLIAGAIIASCLVIFSRFRGDFAGADEFQRLTERSSAGGADPNDLALLLAVALPACLWSNRWQVRYLVSALAITAIVFTGSRGAVASLGVGAIAAIFLIVTTSEQSLRKIVQALAAAAGAVWLAWILLPAAVLERMKSIPTELSSGSLTNRTSLWQAAWEQFGENPFLGTGSGTVRDLIYQRTGRDLVAHNTHLSFLVELGLTGWLLFILALSAAWAGAVRSRRSVGWLAVSMAILTTGTLVLSWEYNKLLWVILILAGSRLSATRSANPSDTYSARVTDVPHNRRRQISGRSSPVTGRSLET